MNENHDLYENETKKPIPPQQTGKENGDGEFEEPGLNFKELMKKWVIPVALVMAVAFLLSKFVFFFVIVPTGSMIPTIQEHSFLFATRVHNPEKSLQRGDIVVFNSDELGKLLVKRLIGLPGETVVVDESGKVTVNGVPLEEPYVKNQDTLPGEFQVPVDSYLFFGDNRSGSDDARRWQQPYIPVQKITGEARFTLWPFSNFGLLD
ncbi:MAG: signal peptidase I [Angelakisella sp.]